MKKSKLILTLFTLSLSVNAFFLLTGFEPQSQCPEIPTYGSSTSISNTEAQRCIDNYIANVPKDAVTGGVITGSSFKQAFCPDGTNGISYYLAQDPERNIANGDVFIVFTGVDVAQIIGNFNSTTGKLNVILSKVL